MTSTGTFRTLDDWLTWLETLSPREIVLGLERVRLMLDRLEPRRPPLIVNVAGTNGKGSSVAMLEALLRSAGLRTGCYTSPHLVRYNERIRIEGVPASDRDIIDAFADVEQVREGVPLTYFEFGTLAAVLAFARADLDAWILEVGMGGRLDAVNAIDPHAVLITNVSLDHCDWLGADVESIAREKAAVMRGGKPAIFGAPEVPAAVLDHARKVGANLLVAGRDFSFEEANDHWSWQGKRKRLEKLSKPGLVGSVQLQNGSAVLALVEALIGKVVPADLLSAEKAGEVLANTRLAGRFEVINDRWILDVAHNPDAARALGAQLALQAKDRPVTAILGVLGDKDVGAIIEPLAMRVQRWIAVPVAGSSRAAPAWKTASAIANVTGRPCRVAESLDAAMQRTNRQAHDGGLVLITGSFYVVGPALEWLQTHSD